MATDGSVKGNSGGAAVVIQDKGGNIFRISIPIDADNNSLTSYKTELHALLGAFILLHRLTPPLI